MPTDTRKTVSAAMSNIRPGAFDIPCDDGSWITSASFFDSPEGTRVEVWDPANGPTGDGPILTDVVRAQLMAMGASIPFPA